MGNIAYYRVSTKRQGKSGLGLESQRAIVAHYYHNGETPTAEFTEVESAKGIDNRPELQAAIRLCVDGGHTLVVAKVDRLSRKTEDALAIYSQLNGRLVACDIPNLDKFTLTIFMAIADRERELVSIRTKAALKEAKKRGVKLGNPAHLTAKARAKGPIAKRQSAIADYRQVNNYIRDMRADGLSYDHIAGRLNDDKFKTRQGKPFQAMTVYRIVKRNGGSD